MRTVDLHPVKACLFDPAGGLTIGMDQREDLVGGHLPCGSLQVWVVHCRGSDRLGYGLCAALHPSVADLHRDLSTFLVNRIGQLSQAGNQRVGVDARHLRVGFPRGMHVHVPGDDQPYTAPDQLPVELLELGQGPSVAIRHPLSGGGPDEPVGQGQGADVCWCKENVHRLLPPLVSTDLHCDDPEGR